MQISFRIATTFIVILMLISGCDLQKQSKTTLGYDSGIAAYQRGHYQIALHDFESRANRGDKVAQFCLAYMLQHGEGIKEPDIEGAKKWYEKAAMQNYHPAQNNLAVLYARDAESAADKSTHREIVTEWLKAAAQKGNATAQYNLYIIDPKKHVDWLDEAVDRNYVPALNQMLFYLVLVEKDMEKDTFKRVAKDIFERVEKAAKQGDAVSRRNLGYCYEKGLSVEKDPEKALEWYTKAGDKGDITANYNAGQLYRTGEGVDVNLEAAIEYYFRAATKNDIEAQNVLGVVYATKYEKDKNKTDLEMATRWYLRAAQQDDAIAQTNIGSFFSEGTDIVPQDYGEAYFWYSLALRNEENRGELSKASGPNHLRNTDKDRDELAKILDEKEKTEIDERVGKWEPKQLVKYGTGFYIDEHHILTNAHVVISNWGEVTRGGKPTFWDEFRIPYRRVKLVTCDEDSDLALLYDLRENIEHATFRWNESVESGEKVSVFGYPQSHRLSYEEGNITNGIVSSTSDMIEFPTQFENRFQHTAPIQPGNSGGPVFDSAGKVIGVNVTAPFVFYQMFVDDRSIGRDLLEVFNRAQNINFAIKSDVVQDFLITKNIRSVPLKETDINIQFGGIEVIDGLDDTKGIDGLFIRVEDLFKDIDKRSVEETVKPVAIPVDEIRKEAKKFTWPIVCFRNKEDPPLKLQEIRIDDLVKEREFDN